MKFSDKLRTLINGWGYIDKDYILKLDDILVFDNGDVKIHGWAGKSVGEVIEMCKTQEARHLGELIRVVCI